MQFRICILTLMLLAATAARAFDFGAATASGQQVYYSVIEGTTEVVAVNPDWSEHTAPAGLLVLDATVDHEGTTYHLTAIAPNAFQSCDELTGIVVPEGVTSIGRMAFAFCTALDSVSLPSTLEQIGTMAFTSTAFLSNASHLTDDGLLIAGSYLIATRNNVEDSLVVPEGILGLGNMSVYNCQQLNKVILPSTLRFIGDLSFQDCRGLDTLLLHTTQPPALGYDAFLNTAGFIVAVPCGAATAYTSREEWREQTIVELCSHEGITPTAPENPVSATLVSGGILIKHSQGLHCTVSDMTGRQLSTTHGDSDHYVPLPSPGIYVVSAPGVKALKVIYFK